MAAHDLPPVQARFCLAVFRNEQNEILLLRRAADDDFAPGLWGFPGGHIHEGETPDETIVREVREEVGFTLTSSGYELLRRVGPVRDTLYGGIFEIHLYLYRAFADDVVRLNEEHDAAAWVSREDYHCYAVVNGIDEDLRYLNVWPVEFLNADKLPTRFPSERGEF
jgi:8-oxo-dGTP diphosphatase